MKKLLLNLFLIIIILSGGAAFGQKPNISYSSSSYVFTVGTPISPSPTPTNIGGAIVAGIGSATPFAPINTPFGVAIDPTTGFIFAIDNTDGYLYKIDPNSGAVTLFNSNTLSFGGAQGIAIDKLGNIYITDAGNFFQPTAVYIFNDITGGVGPSNTFTTGFNNPYGVTIDATNNAYIADAGNAAIYELAVTSHIKTTIKTGLGTIFGLTIDLFNNFYYTVAGGTTVTKIPYGAGTATVYSGYSAPRNLFSDAAGNVFVGDYGNNVIKEISPGGLQSTIITTGVNTPRQAITGAAGDVYEADYGTNYIKKSSSGLYRISATLPPGLNFDSNTGIISGIPTSIFPSTNYTVTASNGSGTSIFIINITVNPPAPIISYSPNSYALILGTAVPSTISPNNTGGAVTGTVSYGAGTIIINSSPTVTNPWGMGVDPNGNVYVVNNKTNTVTEYSTSGVTSSFGTGGPALSNPVGIAFDSFGNGYVLNGSGSVFVYNAVGIYQSTIITGLLTPQGIAIDNSNNLYTTNNSKTISKYTTAGAVIFSINASNTNYSPITGVAIDPVQGLVFVNDNSTSGNSIDYYNNVTGTATPGVIVFTSSIGYGIRIDGSRTIFETQAGTSNSIKVYNAGGTLMQTLTAGFNSPRGVTTDNKGDVFVSDFTNNTVTEFKPQTRYYISGQLPPGLLFNGISGQITGTPTTIFPITTFYVVAYNAAGVSNSTPITLSCGTTKNWIGTNAANTLWTTGANWSGGSAPGNVDIAYISANSGFNFTVLPTIPSGNVTVGSIIMGTLNASATPIAAGVNVNGGTLNVSASITYRSDASSNINNAFIAMLQGTGGVINANSISITASNSLTFYTEKLSSSVTNLNIAGNITLSTSRNSATKYGNATFNIIGGTVLLNGVVQTNNANAVNTSTFGVSNGTLQFVNATALSGLSPTGTNAISFNNSGATIEYAGTTAQTVYTNIGITGLSPGPSYQNIQFSGIGAKTPNAGNLNISGDFTNTLANDATNYIPLTTTPVFFNGTVAQSLAGGAGTGTILNNVTFSGASTKTMTSGSFSVISSGLLTMSGSSTSTILNAGGFLTLISDVNGSATVPAFTGPVISGNVNVQRYITGGTINNKGYRLVSSPVYAATVGSNNVYSLYYPINNIFVKGSGGTGAGFDAGGNPNIYLFRENFIPSNSSFTSGNFRGLATLGTAATYAYSMDVDGGPYNVPVGNGFLMYFRGDRTAATIAAEASSSYIPVSATLTATGLLNQGAITVADWFTPSSLNLSRTSISGDTTINGFNLVGNPYASSIDWDNYSTSAGSPIAAPGVGPFLYILDNQSSNYNVYQSGSTSKAGTIAPAGSNIIPSGQGFFVVAGSASASITFNEAAKTNNQATAAIGNLFMGTPPVANTRQYMRLMLAKDSIHVDGIVINFNSTAKAQYVFGEDAPYKVGNGPVSLASTSADNIGLAINTLPLPTGTQVIKLQVNTAVDGVYTLKLSELKSVPEIYDVWLKDAYRKDSLDIKHNPTYAFDVIKSDTSSFGKNRFSLIIRQNPLLALHLLDFAGSKLIAGTQITWKTENEQNYTNFTVVRSTDNGATFQVIGGFPSTGAGTYSFIDKSPVTNTDDQYKLKLVDLNGNVTYSNIVIIQYAPGANNIARNGMTIFPNPAIGTINVSISQTIQNPSYQIQVVNNLGSIVKTAISNNSAWQDDVSRLVPGTYIIKVINNANKAEVGKGTFVKL